MPQEVDGSGEIEDGSNLPPTNSHLPPVIQKLRDRPRRRYNPIWPEGTRQPFTQELAQYYLDLVSTSDTSLLQLLRDHPELPPHKQLDYWRRHKPEFAEGLKAARKNQADFLVQKCADLAKNATPQTAHLARVQFDIYRWLAAKFHPEVYGEKLTTPPNTTVNVGIAISPERLAEIRNKLDITRTALLKPHSATPKPLP
jgi:hypothetical protein